MRNVRIATVSFHGERDVAANIQTALKYVDQAIAAEADIIALPETCMNRVSTPQPVPGPITDALAERARQAKCHIIAPQVTLDSDGKLYNTAVWLNPQGEISGCYRKIFPTDYEMAAGIWPGETATTFRNEFGCFGIAICFDLNFHEVIEGLVANGAELVFFVSAYPGGSQLQRWALDHSVYIVSAHQGGTGCFIDKTGQVLQTGDSIFQPVVVRDINLDREILHLDYNWNHMPAIVQKYGRAIHTDVHRPEAIFALESRSSAVTVPDIMAEFGLETYREYLARARRCRLARLQGEQVLVGPTPKS